MFPGEQYIVACGSTRVGTGADSVFEASGDCGADDSVPPEPESVSPPSDDSVGDDVSPDEGDSLGEDFSDDSGVEDSEEVGPEPRLDPAACAAEAGERTPVIDSSRASTIVAHTSARIRDAMPVVCRGVRGEYGPGERHTDPQ